MASHDELRGRAEALGLTFLPAVSAEMLDPALVKDVPVEWARTNGLLPVRIDGESCVLTADPDRVGEQQYLELLLGCSLRPVVTPAQVITESIESCYYSKDDTPDAFLRGLAEEGSGEKPAAARSDDLLQAADKAPVTQLLNLILLEAVKRSASDIHFEPFESDLRVRYRIDGVLYDQTAPPKHLEDALVSRIKVMARMDIAERRLPQDGMAKVRVGDREIDIRVSTVPVAEGERVVLRVLARDAILLPLVDLGMPGGVLDRFERLLGQSNGMVVVSGPTGSGKTTTLYAALGSLDSVRKNILTIEDPIEYQLSGIGQIQVKPKIGLTFANGLRHILRQDPDIVLVGETRDIDTAEIALRASLTGHLVFTTLHTNDAPGAVLRLLDMGVESYLLASCLRGVLAQRLVRRLCPGCSRETTLSDSDMARLGDAGKSGKAVRGREAAGCERCLEGYKGRVGLFELMTVGPALSDLIRSGDLQAEAVRKAAQASGMVTLVEDGLAKIEQGVTSLNEVAGVVG